MGRKVSRQYTKEFKEETVALVIREDLGICEASRRLQIPSQTLGAWVQKYLRSSIRPVTDQGVKISPEAEISRLKRELAEARMERDILKKATAYFAKESL